MNEAEKREFKDVIKGMSEEEHNEAVMLMPDDLLWDELYRRNKSIEKNIDGLGDALGFNLDDTQRISEQAWNSIRFKYNDTMERYKKAREIMR